MVKLSKITAGSFFRITNNIQRKNTGLGRGACYLIAKRGGMCYIFSESLYKKNRGVSSAVFPLVRDAIKPIKKGIFRVPITAEVENVPSINITAQRYSAADAIQYLKVAPVAKGYTKSALIFNKHTTHKCKHICTHINTYMCVLWPSTYKTTGLVMCFIVSHSSKLWR